MPLLLLLLLLLPLLLPPLLPLLPPLLQRLSLVCLVSRANMCAALVARCCAPRHERFGSQRC